jgi:hypothetical protein
VLGFSTTKDALLMVLDSSSHFRVSTSLTFNELVVWTWSDLYGLQVLNNSPPCNFFLSFLLFTPLIICNHILFTRILHNQLEIPKSVVASSKRSQSAPVELNNNIQSAAPLLNLFIKSISRVFTCLTQKMDSSGLKTETVLLSGTNNMLLLACYV